MLRNLLEMWPAILFGWPAILAALALSATGIVHSKRAWPLIGAILILPVSFYLAGSPKFGWLAIALPLLLSGSSAAIHYRRPGIAWLLLAPVAAVFVWLAVLVVNE